MMQYKRGRRGIQLTEIVIAMAVAAGPMLLAVTLIRNNAAGARFNRERATARLVLMDLAELLMGENEDGLKEKLANSDQLTGLLDARIDHMPEPAKKPYKEQIEPIKGRLSGNLVTDGAGLPPGLVRMNLRAVTSDSKTVVLTVLFRPKARGYLAGNWGGQRAGNSGGQQP